jgi:hypothetical protein
MMPKTHFFALGWLCAVLAGPAVASDYQPITDKDAFLATLNGRKLTIGLFDLSLNVLPDGKLSGTAMGWDVTGTWAWKDGLFCREMDWSGYKIEYDCQTVEQRGEKLRFTAEEGAGRAADFRLR